MRKDDKPVHDIKQRGLAALLICTFSFALLAIPATTLGQSGASRVLRVGFSVTAATLESMDPHARTGANIAYFENIMEPLVAFANERGDMRPMLAENWRSSPDGAVWTFRLRRNVKFHDDSLFKADAVQYAMDRIYAIKQSPAYSLLAEKIKTFSVLDDNTVQFTVNRGGPSLLHLLTMLLMVSPASGKRNDKGDSAQAFFRDNAVGTGPYKLQRWDRRSLQVLVRNTEYWGGWDGAHYTGVVYQEIPEATTQQLMLERGDLDIALTIPIESLPAMKRNSALVVQDEPGLRVWLMRLNIAGGVTREVRVRKALAHAFDYDGFLQAQANITSRATGPVPAVFMGGWTPENLPKFDLDRAKTLLTEAGVAQGTVFRVIGTRGVPEQRISSEILQAGLRKIGYEARIDIRDWSDWSQQVVNWTEKDNADPSKIPSEIIHLLVPPRMPDPWAFLWFNYHSDATRGAGRNSCQYRVQAVGNLIDGGSVEVDSSKRREAFKQAVRRIVDDQPDIFFANDVRIYVRRRSVQTLGLHPSWAEGIRFYQTRPGN